jgi:hypothetical protein
MWREARLAFTDSVAALNCSVVPAHPWVYGLGQQTENGAYLSPANAIAYLAGKLAQADAGQDVVIMMVTGQTHDNFMAGLNGLADVFPAPAFTQVKRLAESAATLALEKMQIPARFSGGLPPPVPLSVPTSRTALASAAISAAQDAAASLPGLDALKDQMKNFAQLRDAMVNDISGALADLQGRSARAWVFTGSGDMASTLLALAAAIPEQSAIYTAAMMLVGDNLDGIKGMIHDLDPDAGA